MKAALFNEPGKPLEIASLDDPQPGPGELVLQVKGCGICGSDLHFSELPGLPAGIVMGHEFAGEVVEVGKDGGDFKTGERVTALPAIGCGACVECLNGYVLRCKSVRGLGFGDVRGAFAEYVVVGKHETMRLPDAVATPDAALVEPLSVGLHAVDDARIQPGNNLLIAGAGPVGLAIAIWARHFGAREIVVSDPVAGRRALAEKLGATATIDPSSEEVGPAFAAVAGGAPDVIFECVGRPGILSDLIDISDYGKKIIGAGVCMQPDTFFPAGANMKELILQWVAYYRRQDFEMTLDMLDAGRIEPLGLVTDRIGLEALPEAFEALRNPTTQCKVIVEPS